MAKKNKSLRHARKAKRNNKRNGADTFGNYYLSDLDFENNDTHRSRKRPGDRVERNDWRDE